MKNTLLFCATALFSFCAFNASASTLSPEQALSRAMSQGTTPSRVKSMSATTTPQLILTQTNDDVATVYLFSGKGANGYLLVSADDVAPALLGYGDTQITESSAINPTLRWWIDEYGRQIQWARDAGMPASIDKVPAADASLTAIEPMTTTRWNQNAPFNDDCPEINGTRCVTGCVATALSQVMKYHNWPKTGTGSNSYTPSSVGSTLSVNFANTTYDWDNMIDVYDGNATTTQKNAVATLMLSAGVSVNMDYTTDESSATSFAAAQAMVNYFNYDKGIVFYSRDYYTINDWNNLVYNQLKNYGPVQYSGQSNDGGHSFVCDGYSSDGYFHINWGWGGMSDGYFLLTALNPTSQGIGGSTSGYNFDQDIIGNVKPADGTSSSIVPNFVAQSFQASQTSVSLGDKAEFIGPFYSFSLADVTGYYGVKLVDSNGNVSYLQGSSFSELEPQYGVQLYEVTLPASLAEGTYTITPAVSDTNGNWYDTPVLVGSEQVKSMTVANGSATFTTDAASTISVNDVQTNTEFYIGARYELTATVTNNGTQEYLGGIRLMLINSNDQAVAEGDEYPVDLAAGESLDVTYLSTWTAAQNTTLSAGSYYICFVDENGDQLSDMQTITLNAQSSPSLTLSSFAISGDSQNIDKSNIEFTGTLDCSAGYFGSTLTLVIFPDESGSVTSVATYSTDPIFIGAGQSSNLDIKADFTNGVAGKRYFAMLYNGTSPVADNQIYFTISASTDGVNNLSDDISVKPVETQYYTLSGVQVSNPESLANGLYILRQVMSDGSVNVQKSVLRN